MKKIRIIAVVILLGLFIGCREKEVFPSATQEGKNTFGLKIDGKVWLPKQSLSIPGGLPKLISNYYIDRKMFGITARKEVGDEIFIFTISDIKSEGIYYFNIEDNSNDGAAKTIYKGKLVDDEYFLIQGGVNEVEITKLDTINKIVSGVFKCQFKAKNKRSVINITDGVFDVIYDN